MSEFKKVFNQSKLNAPNAEEFVSDEKADAKENNGGEREATTGSKSSIKITKNNTSPSKKTSPSPPASPKSPKIDFTQFESLKSAPRVNDRIAFQVCLSLFFRVSILI